MSPGATLKVMLVDDNPRRAAQVEACLREAGVESLCLVPEQATLLVQIEREAPDVIVIDLDSPGRDLLESLSIVSTHNPTPIVMFSGAEDPDFIARAVDAGVTAYLVDGVKAAKVKPIIDVAMAQFRQYHRLRSELATTQNELSDRKLIDQAKGLLMKHCGNSEQEAYACIRQEAMDRNLKTAEVSRLIIERLAGPRRPTDTGWPSRRQTP